MTLATSGPLPADPKTVRPPTRATRLLTRLQGFEPRESPCYHPPGVTRVVGADPLLGFHLPRVLPLPGAAVPLYGLLSRTCGTRAQKTATGSVCPRVSTTREVGLPLSSAADPFEFFVLVLATRREPKLVGVYRSFTPNVSRRRPGDCRSHGRLCRPRARAVDPQRPRRFAVGVRPVSCGPTRTTTRPVSRCGRSGSYRARQPQANPAFRSHLDSEWHAPEGARRLPPGQGCGLPSSP